MPAPGAMEVPGTAAHSHPQPATNTPVPSPSTFLAAVQQRLLVWLLLTSPLPFGAQDPLSIPPPGKPALSPLSVTTGTEHQVTLSLPARPGFDPALAGCASGRRGLGRPARVHPDTPAHSGQEGRGGPPLRSHLPAAARETSQLLKPSLVSDSRTPLRARKPTLLLHLPASADFDKAKPCPKPAENSPPGITIPS